MTPIEINLDQTWIPSYTIWYNSAVFIDVAGVCGSKQTHSCQAVSDMGLNVTCSRCPPGVEVEWKVDNITLVATSRTLVLSASELKPGCYTCECLNSTGMTYNVTVSDKGKCVLLMLV